MSILLYATIKLLLLLLVLIETVVRGFPPPNKRYVIPNCFYLKVSEKDDVDNSLEKLLSRRTVKSTSSTPFKKQIPMSAIPGKKINSNDNEDKRKMNLMWCTSDLCKEVLRERVVGDHNTIVFNGPATGQVAYKWNRKVYPVGQEDISSSPSITEPSSLVKNKEGESTTPDSSTRPPSSPSSGIASVLLLVKRDDTDLLQIAAENVRKLTKAGIDVLLVPDLAAKLKHYYDVDDRRISLFEKPRDPNEDKWKIRHVDDEEEEWVQDMNYVEPFPDLVCTLGGDGMLIYASMLFQGPIPPLLAISGGSLGFLTSFSQHEMTDAIKVALGMEISNDSTDVSFSSIEGEEDQQVYPPIMSSYPSYEPPLIDGTSSDSTPRFIFGSNDYICMTIRMRLDCRVVNREGVVRARYNVLNEVVIDRGSSPYLAALECFCDDVHLTTVQADGVIFATPSGSTAYSMAAGGSVVHPAVPSILVTPICPHVLSFRSMVFPDHVVLRCFVPDDSRSTAMVAFDGKHRRELQRGDSVQIQMSAYPVPTINKGDHSSDWLESLKRSFNFNTRPRQKPLS